jgi:hypothetical protein
VPPARSRSHKQPSTRVDTETVRRGMHGAARGAHAPSVQRWRAGVRRSGTDAAACESRGANYHSMFATLGWPPSPL